MYIEVKTHIHTLEPVDPFSLILPYNILYSLNFSRVKIFAVEPDFLNPGLNFPGFKACMLI